LETPHDRWTTHCSSSITDSQATLYGRRQICFDWSRKGQGEMPSLCSSVVRALALAKIRSLDELYTSSVLTNNKPFFCVFYFIITRKTFWNFDSDLLGNMSSETLVLLWCCIFLVWWVLNWRADLVQLVSDSSPIHQVLSLKPSLYRIFAGVRLCFGYSLLQTPLVWEPLALGLPFDEF
jgi:hypothetical protein